MSLPHGHPYRNKEGREARSQRERVVSETNNMGVKRNDSNFQLDKPPAAVLRNKSAKSMNDSIDRVQSEGVTIYITVIVNSLGNSIGTSPAIEIASDAYFDTKRHISTFREYLSIPDGYIADQASIKKYMSEKESNHVYQFATCRGRKVDEVILEYAEWIKSVKASTNDYIEAVVFVPLRSTFDLQMLNHYTVKYANMPIYDPTFEPFADSKYDLDRLIDRFFACKGNMLLETDLVFDRKRQQDLTLAQNLTPPRDPQIMTTKLFYNPVMNCYPVSFPCLSNEKRVSYLSISLVSPTDREFTLLLNGTNFGLSTKGLLELKSSHLKEEKVYEIIDSHRRTNRSMLDIEHKDETFAIDTVDNVTIVLNGISKETVDQIVIQFTKLVEFGTMDEEPVRQEMKEITIPNSFVNSFFS